MPSRMFAMAVSTHWLKPLAAADEVTVVVRRLEGMYTLA